MHGYLRQRITKSFDDNNFFEQCRMTTDTYLWFEKNTHLNFRSAIFIKNFYLFIHTASYKFFDKSLYIDYTTVQIGVFDLHSYFKTFRFLNKQASAAYYLVNRVHYNVPFKKITLC